MGLDPAKEVKARGGKLRGDHDTTIHKDAGLSPNLATLWRNTPFVYAHPLPNAVLVSPFTTIGFRSQGGIREDTIHDKIEVSGDLSGDRSSGEALLLDDGRTVLFKPIDIFAPGERVFVSVKAGIETTEGDILPAAAWNFTMSWRNLDTYSGHKAAQPRVDKGQTDPETLELLNEATGMYWLDGISKNETWDELETQTDGFRCNDGLSCDADGRFVAPNSAYRTLPKVYPRMHIARTGDLSQLAPGYVFLWSSPNNGIIMTSEGDPVFATENSFLLFSPTPQGQLVFSREGPFIRVVGPDYKETASFSAQHGQGIDSHEFQLTKNGNGLLFGYDLQPLDTTKIRPDLQDGGEETWTVGIVIQEVSPASDVVFEWRSWDHIPSAFWETSFIAHRRYIKQKKHKGGFWDLGHANSLEETDDKGIILSLRALSQAIKINRDTGKIEWRLGGESGNFKIIDDPNGSFMGQHDIRALGGNRITVFDNAGQNPDQVPINYPSYNSSRAVDYKLEFDRQGRPTVAALVGSYEIGVKAHSWGSYRRLPNGNRVIGPGRVLGGNFNPIYIETNAKSQALLTMHSGRRAYRAVKADWHGFPSWKPTALLDNNNPDKTVRLHFSWNGATEVSKWRILIGATDEPAEVLEEMPKTQFEHWIDVPGSASEHCMYFQAVAIDAKGEEMDRSTVVASAACT
ncbi:unnamed protein product [Vitrella brassicaformis CCMP3155]|uniref:Uncharacterized protein n=1 Tax=Vitrella brassicaformis (strain CCMP3155) TaxID=1169540 RepID=A0A0G4GN71_VITBC|nr:unnamed protein product [Vitrella brassicaformis CCMP3155]|eukprot:CEM31605.1 unnamed protein product [Vitrella brassicaformis CCMP3155]